MAGSDNASYFRIYRERGNRGLSPGDYLTEGASGEIPTAIFAVWFSFWFFLFVDEDIVLRWHRFCIVFFEIKERHYYINPESDIRSTA